MRRRAAPFRAPIALLAGPTLVLGLALAGCSSTADTTTSMSSTDAGSLGTAVPPERAFAALPAEAGAVVSVVERRTADGDLRQTITLAGDSRTRGEDRIEVVRRRSGKGGGPDRIDADALQAEMAEALPGVAMTVSPQVITTAGGPVVGVATGTTGDGLACLYAWSNGAAHRQSESERLLGLRFDDAPKTSVRVRLCRRGTSAERLVALAEGLRLGDGVGSSSAYGGGRVAGPVAGSDALAAAGYGYATPAPVAAAPASPERVAPPPRRVAETRAKPHPAATPSRVVARSHAPEPPATVAAPIPLPSGG